MDILIIHFCFLFFVFEGEHKTEEFVKLNPHSEVPVLVDGELKIYGACPILLYLGEKYTSFNRFGETQKEKQMVIQLTNIYNEMQVAFILKLIMNKELHPVKLLFDQIFFLIHLISFFLNIISISNY